MTEKQMWKTLNKAQENLLYFAIKKPNFLLQKRIHLKENSINNKKNMFNALKLNEIYCKICEIMLN